MRAMREAVFAELFTRLQGVAGLITVSRRVKAVQDMQPEEMPAAFQIQGKQSMKFAGSTPTVTDMDVTWAIYTQTPDALTAPSIALNELTEAALAQLSPSPGSDRQTLGGLVEYAAVDGDIEIFEGILGDRAVALIPIRIVLGGF